MSYTIEIRSDDKRTQSLDLRELLSLFVAEPQFSQISQRQLLYSNDGRQHEFWLDLVNGEGDTRLYDFELSQEISEDDERVLYRVNSFTTSIPYGFSPQELLDFWDDCFMVARKIGWQVFDPQAGNYVEAN